MIKLGQPVAPPECPASKTGQHTWARRRDGLWCVDCQKIEFGSSDISNKRPDPSLSDKLETSILSDLPLEFGDTGSSLVDAASYDPGQRVLKVSLKAGSVVRTYSYDGYPPSEWVDFYQAPSKGGFFTRRIRPLYTGKLHA